MRRRLQLICLLMFTSTIIYGQVTISGKVTTAEDGSSLPGVSILEKGTNKGTVTNIEGEYTLTVADDATLVFSFVGFVTQEVSVSGRSSLDIVLDLDITALQEVVVIGYGEVQKDDLTGAVATIGTKEFNQGVTTSPQDLLTGRVAGVTVTSAGGAPGSASTIRIRGGSSLGGATNDPLIVIDGFPLDDGNVSGLSNPLNTLNPNDIESFTILKDASAAAIYGSRASNGVIIITTKKGKEGKLKLNLNSQVSVSSPIKYVDVLSGDEYRTLINDLNESGFSGIDETVMARLGEENTDWQKEIFRDAISHNHNLSANGMVKGIPFRASYGYTDEQGILKTTSAKRHSLSLNLSPTFLNDNLKVNLNAKGTFAHSNFGDEGAVGQAVNFDPTQPVYNGNSKYGGYFAYTTTTLPDGSMDLEGPANTFVSNPVASLALRDNQSDVSRLIGNVQLDYKLPFLPELRANLNLGMDKTDTDGFDNALPGSTWTYRDYTGDNGRLRDYTNETSSELLDFYLNYNKTFGTSKLDVTGGYSWQHFERGGTAFDRNGDENQIVEDSQFKSENFLVSFFGRAIYTLNDKYIATATVRRDGSSRFTGDNQWGTFPALAFAWKINEEGFLSESEVVSNMKLRLGYGITGQQGLSPDLSDPYYPALAKYQRSIGGASYQFGDSFINTLRPSAYDANLKWEETTTINAGIDFGFLEDKLIGSIDVYQRETQDVLNRIPIADGSNFGNYLITNVGTMEIKGYEVSLTARPITTNDISWSISANLSYNNREITKLNKTDDPSDPGVNVGGISGGVGNNIQIHTVGNAPNSFYTFQQVYDESGQPVEGLYVDRSGEGGEVISNEFNKYHNRNPNADYLIGINSRLAYKQLDFSFSGRISLNNYVYNNGLSNNTYSGLYDATGYFSNIRTEAADLGFVNPQYWSDYYVQDASFFKMDNISVGYSFEDLWTSDIDARLSLTVQNAFIITDYKGIDPEVEGGIDNNIYPRPRTILFGVNLNF
ncbi:SusC/RagA family TonB-linked outer membrane protein [Flammeovirgaceae bacterium SG7u.111]|nr:SusC/RagA family TonB-linked outer membrane protein [Flammeovirgaceae bacterium SG7u.132]WPO33682.1 SusC/RagA family TonB-linked outer membrane protein [Flammeovirgaceae bacterium SG7u.111]